MMDNIKLEQKGMLKGLKRGDKIKLEMLVTGTETERDYCDSGPVAVGEKEKKPKFKNFVNMVPMESDNAEALEGSIKEVVKGASNRAKDNMKDEGGEDEEE